MPSLCLKLSQSSFDLSYNKKDGSYNVHIFMLTMTANHDWNTFKQDTAQWEGMGDVGSARYKPALLPPRPTIRVSNYSNYQEIHLLHF